MIRKDIRYENRFLIDGEATEEDIKTTLGLYLKKKDFHSIICSFETCKMLKVKPGDSFITINNNIPDGFFFVNRIG